MTDTTAQPADDYRYADSITPSDVRQADEFLTARLEEQRARSRYDSPEYRAATALAALVRDAVVEVTVYLAAIEEGNRHSSRVGNLGRVQRAWNRLATVLRAWHDHPDYDPAVFRRAQHLDAEAHAYERKSDEAYRAELAAQQSIEQATGQ